MPAKKSSKSKAISLLEDAIVTLRKLRVEKADVEEMIESVQSDAVAVMQDSRISKVTVKDLTGTLIESSTVEIDPLKLKKAVGAKRWAQITTLTLDKRKLEAAVAAGEISPITVAACADDKPRKPYIKVTQRKGK